MRIRLATGLIILFAVVFAAANLIAFPFPNFGTYSALWAQVYGNTPPGAPICAPGSPYFAQLGDADAQRVSIPFPPPSADAALTAVYQSDCFGLYSLPISQFAINGLTCADVAAYRIDGSRQPWPVACDSTRAHLLIPGTGEPAYIQLFRLGDPAKALAGVSLSHGA